MPNHTHNTSASDRGNLTKVRKYKDASNYLETHMYYDNVGNLVETVDPLGHSTTIDFTDNFTDNTNRYAFAFPKKVTNTLSQYATSKYDFNTGLVKEVTNLRGYTTATVYDAMNRVMSVTEPNSKVTTYAYDDNNRITTKEVTVDTVPNKGQVKTYFDKLYRVVQSRTADPDGQFTVDTEYDDKGRVKKTSNPYRVSGGSAAWTETAYDALDRPTTVTAPDSSTVQYAYINNQTTTTDQAGNQRRYTYNILGQLTTVEEPNPSLFTPVATTYKYYGFGPLYQSTQSAQTRTWVYNWLGQMTSQSLPESGTTSFSYDSAGRLYRKTDARGIFTEMTYDELNRLIQRNYSDGTPAVAFAYDQSSQTGLRTAMSDGLGSVAYTYDAMDRLTSEARTLTGISGTFTTSYVYNVKGDVTQMTYPTGRVVDFEYKTGGGCCNSRLESVTDGTTSTTLVDSITFNAAGGVTGQTLNPGANAVSESFTYSTDGRLQLTRIEAAKGGTSLMDFSYDYGTSSTNTGRVLKRTDTLQPEHSANYVYDSLYRLQQAVNSDGSWGIAWKFDTWGNRLNQYPLGLAVGRVVAPGSDLSYSGNRQTGVTNMTYDNAGNLTNEGVSGSHYYAYNAENQQTSMDGGAATYAYDGEGRRMKRTATINSVTETTYMFYGPGGLLCEFSATNTGATAASSTDKTIYRTSEKTGSAVLLFNSSGLVIDNNRTLPYGEAWLSDVASTNDKKFTTYDRDKESGLDYAMARMYASTGGRFTSPDEGPIALQRPSSLNRYAYGALDPLNKKDPSGNSWMDYDPRTCSMMGGAAYQWMESWTINGQTTITATNEFTCDIPYVPSWINPGWFAYAYMFGYAPQSVAAGGVPQTPAKCSQPTLPTGIGANQIQKNVKEANDLFNNMTAVGGGTAGLGALAGFLTRKFQPGGDWDYKSKYSPTSQPGDRANAQVFGNFNFGAVMASLGLTYTETQNVAGVVQIAIHLGGGAGGQGIPFLEFPFGDQPGDAADIKRGWTYQTECPR